MWPFHKAQPKLSEALERLEKLERTVSLLRLEWSDVQELLTKRLRKISQAAKAVAQSEELTEQAGGPELSANEQLILSRLPPAQRAVQERILISRKRPNGGQ